MPSTLTRPAATVLAAILLGACGGSAGTPAPSTVSSSPSPYSSVSVPASAKASAGAAGSTAAPSASSSAAPSGSSASPSGSSAGGDGLGSVTVTLEPFATDLDSPVFLTHAGDGTGTLYVVEQGGTVLTFTADGTRGAAPFLDIHDRISAGGERGLLGLAFHPRFRDNGRFFVDYTNTDGDTIVSEFRRGPDGTLDPSHERLLLKVDQPFSNHNGGMLAFGPDGGLYIGSGDGGSAGDPQGNGQDREQHLGKILRILVDPAGDAPYGIPKGNAFAGGGGRPEIWDLGLRNPWRFSFDRTTGDLYVGDVGQGATEEIDVHAAGTAGGLNFGWNVMEGPDCYRADSCARDGLTLPVAWYSHEDGCSITGGYVYRGTSSPALSGVYLYSDYCSGTVWGIASRDAMAGSAKARVLIESGYPVSSFGEDEAGELYLVSLGGTVYRVTGR